jgi:hypothetical protein
MIVRNAGMGSSCGCGSSPMAGDHRVVMVPPLGEPVSFGRQFGAFLAIVVGGGLLFSIISGDATPYKSGKRDLEYED